MLTTVRRSVTGRVTSLLFFVLGGLVFAGCLGEAPDCEDDPTCSSAADELRRNRCGDNRCSHRESCSTCPQDCGRCEVPDGGATADAGADADADTSPPTDPGTTPTDPGPGTTPTDPTEPAPAVGNYYVAPTGSDSNPGTATAPLKTIQSAVDRAKAGDVVVVRDGVYQERQGDMGLVITRAGTSEAWIRIVAEHRGKATVDGNNFQVNYGVVFTGTARYVSFEGFEVRNFVYGGLWSNSGAQHIRMARNNIHDIGRICSNTTSGLVGVFVGNSSYYHEIDSNIIHDLGRFAPGENNCYPSNGYWQNHDHGIYLQTDHVLITNNAFYNLKRGWGLQADGRDTMDVKVVNNTFYGANPDRIGKIVIYGNYNHKDWLIQNNIFADTNEAGVYLYNCANVSNMKIQGNISTSKIIFVEKNGPCYSFDSNLENASSPGFQNASSFDFHIQSSSPACQTAIQPGSPAHDIAGKARSTGSVCSGAYQP